MGRSKRVIDLIIRVGFIILCFILTYVTNALSGISYGNVVSLTNDGKVDILTTNGAEATYYREDGKLVVDVTKAGPNYDDITVLLTVNSIKYDIKTIRESLGDKAEEYKEFLDSMEKGPWNGSMSFILTGDSMFSSNKKVYTFVDAALDEYPSVVASSAGTVKTVINDTLTFEPQKGATAMFILGEKSTGPLPAGKYYLSADINLQTNANSDSAVPTDVVTSLLTTVFTKALTETPFSAFFEVSSLLTFYGVMVGFGFLFFFYQDLRAAFKIAVIAMKLGYREGVTVLVHTYVNGSLVSSKEEVRGGRSGIPDAIIMFVLSFMAFTILIPIRTIIVIVKDIICIARGDDDEEGFPIIGNILGSIGFYALFAAFVGFMASWNTIFCIISLVAAIPLLIFASKLCKRSEEYWDYN